MRSVVVIEENSGVREVVHSMFEMNGFRVSFTGTCIRPEHPHDCYLDCWASRGIAPDLIFAAVLAPRECSGVEAALKSLVRWPDAKVILSSASPISLWPESVRSLLPSMPECSYAFLPKPFTAQQLIGLANALLGDGGNGAAPDTHKPRAADRMP